jgi:hypothetical protein
MNKDENVPHCWRCGEILHCKNGNEYFCKRCRDAVKQYCRRTGADRGAVWRIVSDRMRPIHVGLWRELGLVTVEDENDGYIDPSLIPLEG